MTAPDLSTTPNSHIPPGYKIITGLDNEKFLVPGYLVAATEMDIEIERTRRNLRAEAAPGGVSTVSIDNINGIDILISP